MAVHDLALIDAEFGDLSRWSRCPDFWTPKPEQAKALLASLETATRKIIGRSAGRRDILALEFGEREPLDHSNDNLHSALAAEGKWSDATAIFPPVFYGSRRRVKPVLAIQGGVHGGELTGTVAMLNLCRVIERGVDLRNKEWPRLHELACQTRLVMIPWLNPDATDRWPLPNTSGVPIELYHRCTQGIAKDGTRYRYPDVKRLFPIPPEETAFMGSYYNDAGVNLQYDIFSVTRQPETTAWMQYFLSERPDGILIWHCNSGSMISEPGYYLPPGHQHQHSRIGGAVRARLQREGFDLGRLSHATLPGLGKPIMEQYSSAYHVCGGTPIMCELPAGADDRPYTCEQMLDIGLITIEEILAYAHSDGLRPYEFWDKVKRTLGK